MSPIIGTIKSSQVEAFHNTLDHVAREGRYLFLTSAPAIPATERFVSRMLDDNNPFVVATGKDGAIAGWCNIYPEGAPIHGHVGVLGIALLPEFRGRGLGTKLLSAALDKAYGRGFTRVELTVYANNRPAIRLYEKFSFETEGVKKLSAQIGGDMVDVLMMARLSPSLKARMAA
jgi:ribosomal protein S18 acetylase RimI-like enzyme